MYEILGKCLEHSCSSFFISPARELRFVIQHVRVAAMNIYKYTCFAAGNAMPTRAIQSTETIYKSASNAIAPITR